MSEPISHGTDSNRPTPQFEVHSTARPTRPRPQKKPWALISVCALLSLLLIAAGGVGFYLYQTTDAWRHRSGELTERVQDLANEIATVSEEFDATVSALERTETQLDTARDSITELADEKAQLGDEHAVQQRVVEYQERVSEIAADILFALDECISGQNRVIDYIKDADRYDTDDLKRIEGEVADYCSDATDASEQLLEELSE